MATHKRRGFSLIIALALMALMVLLTLTLSALIQVEAGAATQQRNMALARQNALVGAYQAMGVLQQQLGPDQRVTARADMASASAVNPYWVGVWNTATLSVGDSEQFSSPKLGATPQRWLVSGPTTSNPTTAIATASAVTLSPAVTASSGLIRAVTVPRVTITTSDRAGGGYAWWVSDEGMKASLSLDNRPSVSSTSTAADLQRRQLALVRAGLEMASSDAPVGEAVNLSEENLKLVGKLSSAGQLPYLDRALFTPQRANELAHDLTGMSFGVLANTLPGTSTRTLKVDLTTADNAQAGLVLDDSAEGILAYLNVWTQVGQVTDMFGRTVPAFPIIPRTPADNTPVNGKAYFSVAPIFTEWFFGMAINKQDYPQVWVQQHSGQAQTRVHPYYEMWNPYTTAMVPINGHIQLRISNLPKFRLNYWYRPVNGNEWLAQPDRPVSEWFDYLSLFGNGSSPNYMAIHLLNQGHTADTPLTYEGGDMLHWTGIQPTRATGRIGTAGADEHSAAFGISKEQTVETDRIGGKSRYYYETLGAEGYGYFKTPVWGLYPTETRPAGVDPGLSQTQWLQRYVCFSMEWESRAPTVGVWYVPGGGTTADKQGNLGSAVLLSTMPLPPPDVSVNQPSGALQLRYLLSNFDFYRAAFHYARIDAEKSGFTGGSINRRKNDWLFADNAVDPRCVEQRDDTFMWAGGTNDPNAYFMDSTGTTAAQATQVLPNPDNTLTTQMLDRRSGKLNADRMQSTEIGAYVGDPNASLRLETKGAASPAHRQALFELPTSAPVSLGVLQHVCLEGRQPYCIGNSRGRNAGVNGANVNFIFDRGYLSAITTVSDLALPEKPLPNVNMMSLWTSDADIPTAAESDFLANFMSKGAFNINSTSVNAWKTFLAGSWIEDWEYVRETGSDDTVPWARASAQLPVVRRAFFRFAHTANEVFTAPDNTDAMGSVDSKFYRRGVRRLSPTQLDVMANLIVAQIKKRKVPFSCMAEFLSYPVADSGSDKQSVLEYALAPGGADAGAYGSEPIQLWRDGEMSGDGADSGTASSQQYVDVGSPADLSQADILNTLAPVLQARSDTFKVIAYGDVVDADGATAASAKCELLVQRYPEPVVNNPSATQQEIKQLRLTPGSMGRKLKVLSIKWL